jgi:SAM-dependent MidA family methyltransferase
VTRHEWRRWDAAWQEALYGAEGFYRRSAPADHFATSAQGLGSTGQLLAEALVALAERQGLHRIVEVAAGRGELLTALVQCAPASVELVGVEVVDRPDGLPDRVAWCRSPGGAGLPSDLTALSGTLLVAHEWLDVVPCPVAARDPEGTWRYVLVSGDGTERSGEAVDGADLDWLVTYVPDHARRAEVGLPRDTAYADLVSRLDDGVVLAIDYGHSHETRPRDGTLTAYRHGAQVTPVPDGSCDLTAHVSVDSLGAGSLRSQREALHDLLGRATLPAHGLAGEDATAYLQQLSRANALATMTASGGLGGFWWAMTPRRPRDLG